MAEAHCTNIILRAAAGGGSLLYNSQTLSGLRIKKYSILFCELGNSASSALPTITARAWQSCHFCATNHYSSSNAILPFLFYESLFFELQLRADLCSTNHFSNVKFHTLLHESKLFSELHSLTNVCCSTNQEYDS